VECGCTSKCISSYGPTREGTSDCLPSVASPPMNLFSRAKTTNRTPAPTPGCTGKNRLVPFRSTRPRNAEETTTESGRPSVQRI
jgi:hypothetical protein